MVDDKFTTIHNEVLEALSKMSGISTEVRIIFVVWRKTYGYNKKEDSISLSQFSEATGLPERSVSRALRSLQDKKLISRKDMITSFVKPPSVKSVSVNGPRQIRGAQKTTTYTTFGSERSSAPPMTGSPLSTGRSYILREQNVSKPINKYDTQAVKSLIGLTARLQGLPTLGGWGKQIKIIHDLIDKGVTIDQLREAVTNMSQDSYWRGFKFDFVQVSRNFHKYLKGEPQAPLDEFEAMIQEAESPENMAKREQIFDKIRRRYPSV